MPDTDILRINGTDYKVHDSDGRALVAPEELTPTATKAHAIGEPFVYDGKLYRATATIAIGDTIVTTGTGANCEEVPGGLGGQVADLKSAVTNNAISALLHAEEIENTVQSILFDESGNVQSITHMRDNVAIRTDEFTFADGTITETRTLNTGESLTIVTNTNTLQTTVTYTAA